MTLSSRWSLLAAAGLFAVVLWLRWPGFGFSVWNVDEAIHAAAARTILDGGVLYRDAIDQRTPLSYYAVAAVFAVAGDNNLWAVRFVIALLVAATAGLLFVTGRKLGGARVGACAAAAYAMLATCLFYPGDANAANPEWFVAVFTAAAAAVLVGGPGIANHARIYWAGLLLGLAFLSKQPALLDSAAPVAFFLWLAWQRHITPAGLVRALGWLAAGWLTPVALTCAYLGARGAFGDFVYYAWTYNLAIYGAEIPRGGRVLAAVQPFALLAATAGALLVLWLAGAAMAIRRLLQRVPDAAEAPGNPALAYLAVWTLTSLAGAASGGRDFHHYAIQFLPALALGLGLAVDGAATLAGPGRPWFVRAPAALLVLVAVTQLVPATWTARGRTLPEDPSMRVSAYIRTHSAPEDRIFVWGFHPDIYLHSGRRPASRFLYASFLTGLVPWTNVAPGQDTAYAIVPGAMEALLRDLETRRPVFLVDCSAGPNRHWQKYPLEKFPPLNDYVRRHYRVVEGGQFVPQGFRLFQRQEGGTAENAAAELAPEITATLVLGVLGQPLTPVRAQAPHGAAFAMMDGRAEVFAHAPSRLTYQIPAGIVTARGGFGLRAGAYAAENPAPSDGAEFIILWRGADDAEHVLFRRLLQPRQNPGDRGVQSFQVALPGGPGGLEFRIEPGPTGNPASDWTFWSDLMLATFR